MLERVKAHFAQMPPKRQRMVFLFFSVILGVVAVQLVLNAFRDNIVYFFTPSELHAGHVSMNRPLRVGGLVEKGSVKRQGDEVRFTLTDGGFSIQVSYKGMLPALFREGQGVVAEGRLNMPNALNATRILAKHDEKYMPPEVARRLQQSGYWRDGTDNKRPQGQAAP